MSPAVVASLIRALIAIGPSALQAIEALFKAAHGQPVSEADHAALGRAIATALQQSKPA